MDFTRPLLKISTRFIFIHQEKFSYPFLSFSFYHFLASTLSLSISLFIAVANFYILMTSSTLSYCHQFSHSFYHLAFCLFSHKLYITSCFISFNTYRLSLEHVFHFLYSNWIQSFPFRFIENICENTLYPLIVSKLLRHFHFNFNMQWQICASQLFHSSKHYILAQKIPVEQYFNLHDKINGIKINSFFFFFPNVTGIISWLGNWKDVD